MVDYVSDSNELRRRVNAFAFNPGVDGDLANKLQRIPGVEADILTQAPEILYAYRDKLDEGGLRLMGELFTYANEMGWTNTTGGAKGSDNRAELIIRDVRLDLDELKGSVDPATAPEPKAHLRDGFDWREPEPTDAGPAEPPVPPS